jgi:hypothetical protein
MKSISNLCEDLCLAPVEFTTGCSLLPERGWINSPRIRSVLSVRRVNPRKLLFQILYLILQGEEKSMIESLKPPVNRLNLYTTNVTREFRRKHLVTTGRDMLIEGKGGGRRKAWLSRTPTDV